MYDIQNELRKNDEMVVCEGCGLDFYHSDTKRIMCDIDGNYYAGCNFCGYLNPEKNFVRKVHPRAIL